MPAVEVEKPINCSCYDRVNPDGNGFQFSSRGVIRTVASFIRSFLVPPPTDGCPRNEELNSR